MKLFYTSLAAAIFSPLTALAATPAGPLTYESIIRIHEGRGAKGELDPIVRIVSPLNRALVAPGEARRGAGSPNGSGFAVNLEIVTRDRIGIKAREATLAPPVFGIRHVPELERGAVNPDIPGLYVFFDTDLVTPNGTILPKFNNFAAAFNVLGTDDTPGPGVTLWAGWHVLESIPGDVKQVTMTVAVVDDEGRIGLDRIKVRVDGSKTSGQALTPPAESYSGGIGFEDPAGPEVSMIAPRVPTAIAIGPTDNTLTANNGSLFFIQVSALDRSGAGIAVNETGIRAGSSLPIGLIFDPTQIPNVAAGTPAGPNRNFPGLVVTFDVPLRQPNGNVVPAGVNLAPLFDIVGSEVDTASGAVRVTAHWVVGGSLVMPAGKKTVVVSSSVTDNYGKKGTSRSVFAVSPVVSGQALTPNP
ncbi:MAG: hypothetical protein H7Z10_15070 [Gemmatimonadaceae bacterium]|nr:hypothetical protein [Acetobacteraceae bacterium]